MLDSKVSVIIAAYNVEDYIVETMESLFGQTVQSSEIVIVNDGSTDGTLALINSKYGHDSRVRIITQENKGVGCARMVGFNAATGDYLFFCDPDDVVSLDLFEGFNKALNENSDLELYYFSKRSFVDSSGKRNYLKRDTAPSREGWFSKGVELFEDLILSNKYKATTWQYIFKKTMTERFDVTFKGRAHEDQLFSMNVYLHSKLCYATQADRYFQRVRQGSLTNSVKDEHHVLTSYDAYRDTLAVLKTHLHHFSRKRQVATAYMKRGVTWTIKGCIRNRVRLPSRFFALTRKDCHECGVGREGGMILTLPEWHFFAKKVSFELKIRLRRGRPPVV
ncbi:glycosyltransferase family 2 protein [Pseudomonas sp. NPDC087639]|uniref:glycosyltransferase family 2 protein n=1 Tax=Pseudomonas sp. NPDC087639 TaxID=3364445 RepID=UPI00381186D4